MSCRSGSRKYTLLRSFSKIFVSANSRALTRSAASQSSSARRVSETRSGSIRAVSRKAMHARGSRSIHRSISATSAFARTPPSSGSTFSRSASSRNDTDFASCGIFVAGESSAVAAGSLIEGGSAGDGAVGSCGAAVGESDWGDHLAAAKNRTHADSAPITRIIVRALTLPKLSEAPTAGQPVRSRRMGPVPWLRFKIDKDSRGQWRFGGC